MSPTAAPALRAKKGMARRLAASRERKKNFFIMVCLFGVSNVPSTGRSSTFEYWKRKKPRPRFFVAGATPAWKHRKPGDFSPGFRISTVRDRLVVGRPESVVCDSRQVGFRDRGNSRELVHRLRAVVVSEQVLAGREQRRVLLQVVGPVGHVHWVAAFLRRLDRVLINRGID